MKQIISTRRLNMKLTPFIILSIMLFSCSGNGTKSEKNQEITDMDSTELVVIDTMVTSPIESKEKAEESTRVNSKDPVVGTFYCSRSGDIYVFNNDKTGMFTPNGGSGATFNWRLKGKILIVTYSGESEFLGSSKLKYDKSSNSFIEKSISLGNLKFVKQE